MTPHFPSVHAALRITAEQGFREDAPESCASAREQLLLLYRERHARSGRLDLDATVQERGTPWNERDLDGLEWICRLGDAGHAGAARLLRRVLNAWPGAACEAAESGRLGSIAAQFPMVACSLAMRESGIKEPSLSALLGWLEAGEAGHLRSLASEVRELYTGSEQPLRSAGEKEILQRQIEWAGYGLDSPGELIGEIARFRLQRAEGPILDHALRLLERGAQLGSKSASQALWHERYSRAPDKGNFLRDWLATQPSPDEATDEQRMIVGAAIDRGEAGAPPNPATALRWYARPLKLGPLAEAGGGVLDAEICQHVAQALVGSFASLALAWSERGLDIGNQNCFDIWLAAYASGEAGIASDPDVALERARRFLASGAQHGPRDSLLAPRALFNFATRLLGGQGVPADPALAARWLQVGALLGYRAAQYTLGELYQNGRGVERDVAAARAWYEKSAAQGYGPAKIALARG